MSYGIALIDENGRRKVLRGRTIGNSISEILWNSIVGWGYHDIGYFSGGTTGAVVTTTDGLTFSTDTTAQVTKGALSQARSNLAGANSTTLAYFSGGTTGAFVTTTDGLTFSTDTTAQVTKGALSQAREHLTGANSGGI